MITQAQIVASLFHVWPATQRYGQAAGPSRGLSSSSDLNIGSWRNVFTYTVGISVGTAVVEIVGFPWIPLIIADAPVVVTAPRGCGIVQRHLRSNAAGIAVARVWCSGNVSSGNIVLTDPRWPILVATRGGFTDLMVAGRFNATIT
ncbi:MAG: hypothetical protein ACYCST_07930 [Acidimicrobiales bacterium]